MTVRYTQDHEWIRVDGDVGVVGVTEHAASQLGDIVFVDLPEIGASVEMKGQIAVVESVKAASEIYAPVAGEVVEVNAALSDAPETVNEAPEGAGWFFKLKITEPDQLSGLMDEGAYKAYVAETA